VRQFNQLILLSVVLTLILQPLIFAQGNTSDATRKFAAVGPTEPPEKLERSQMRGAVKVTFDLLPTSMTFNLPWNYCMVSENGIKISNFAAETYDPRDFDGTGGAASFEPGMDREGRYVRAWIEHQSDARIVVRVSYALNNNLYDIAHPDIYSGSPYGKGDWADEWFYIYPDATHIRHMRVYTGTAPVSRPFGWDRTPPKVVHEFMEHVVIGPEGHKPTDDIEIDALTLIRLMGDHVGFFYPEGKSTRISWDPYPDDFGEFRDANIMFLHIKSEYKPFLIGMPYGVRVQPYTAEDDLPHVFQTWGYNPDREHDAYYAAIGHMLNYWHYRRTDTTIEQIYFHGMTNTDDPVKELVPLAWSWIDPPKLEIEGLEPDYDKFPFDPAQKAYTIDWKQDQSELEFELSTEADLMDVPTSIVNPAFVVKGWGDSPVELEIDDKIIEPGTDYRIGYEKNETGTDLILWLKLETKESLNIWLRRGKN